MFIQFRSDRRRRTEIRLLNWLITERTVFCGVEVDPVRLPVLFNFQLMIV